MCKIYNKSSVVSTLILIPSDSLLTNKSHSYFGGELNALIK